jgi:hypothetical protein
MYKGNVMEIDHMGIGKTKSTMNSCIWMALESIAGNSTRIFFHKRFSF